MVTFSCDTCQETLKKAKLDNHFNKCPQAQYTCIDCGKTFPGDNYKLHTACISEEQKYQKSLFKPKKNGKQKTLPQQPESGEKVFESINNGTTNDNHTDNHSNFAEPPKSEPLIPQIQKRTKKRPIDTVNAEESTTNTTNPDTLTVSDAKPEKKKKKKKLPVTENADTVNTAHSVESPVKLAQEPNPVEEVSKPHPLEITSLTSQSPPGKGRNVTPVWSRTEKVRRQAVAKLEEAPQIIKIFQSVLHDVFAEGKSKISFAELSDYVCSVAAQKLQKDGIIKDAKTLARLPNFFDLHAMVSVSKHQNTFTLTIPNQPVPINDRLNLKLPNEPDTPNIGHNDNGLGWVVDKNPAYPINI